ncbi:MAG TPA: hypothetical protein VHO91_21505 [Rhodopila sp.]|nr:hypothetical protein [Rhodopila sp.]
MQVTNQQNVARTLGDVVSSAESRAIDLASSRVYRLRMLHPWLYGLMAFVAGGFLVGSFTMTTYANWAYEGVNLRIAFWQVVCGSIGGGLAMVALAFAYARTIYPTLPAMAAAGIIRSRQ